MASAKARHLETKYEHVLTKRARFNLQGQRSGIGGQPDRSRKPELETWGQRNSEERSEIGIVRRDIPDRASAWQGHGRYRRERLLGLVSVGFIFDGW